MSETSPALFVFDNMTTLPQSEPLLQLMGNRHAHIVVLYKHYQPPDKLICEIRHQLVRGRGRGYKILPIDSLSMIHSTQRTVYTIQREMDFAPDNKDQIILEKLAEFTSGSPVLVDITSQLILAQLKDGDSNGHIKCQYDSISDLTSNLKKWEEVMLNCLSTFGANPIPVSMATALSSKISEAFHQPHLSLLYDLKKMNYISIYPCPVVIHPSICETSAAEESDFVYMPQHIANIRWESLNGEDKAITLSINYHTLSELPTQQGPHFLLGLLALLMKDKDLHASIKGYGREVCSLEDNLKQACILEDKLKLQAD